MAFEHKPNSGSIFINDRKEKQNQPDWKGDALIGGEEYWISGWDNETRDGKQYISFRLEPKELDAQRGGGTRQNNRDNAPGARYRSRQDLIDRTREKAKQMAEGNRQRSSGLSPAETDFSDDDIPF